MPSTVAHCADAMWFEVGTALPQLSLVPTVRHALAAIDRNVALAGIETQESLFERSISQERQFACLCGALALLALRVRAGVDGVLRQIGDAETLEVGQRIAPGATLAKIVEPTRLKAVLKIAETQVKDVQIGQKAEIDTHNGIIPGHVLRIDPAAQNGTVTVDVKLDGALPKGARPDLNVDGVIELERLESVLYVGRPVQGQEQSTASLFKLTDGGKTAQRVTVKLGRSSVSVIEVLEGLQPGDQVILSDMATWDGHDKVRL
jgi:multidrug efflux pump subunit AcrA (membrane-fusion protein)